MTESRMDPGATPVHVQNPLLFAVLISPTFCIYVRIYKYSVKG